MKAMDRLSVDKLLSPLRCIGIAATHVVAAHLSRDAQAEQQEADRDGDERPRAPTTSPGVSPAKRGDHHSAHKESRGEPAERRDEGELARARDVLTGDKIKAPAQIRPTTQQDESRRQASQCSHRAHTTKHINRLRGRR